MTIGIKTRNFSPTKTEKTFDQDGLGWAPGYEKKFEGTDRDNERYGKNYNRMCQVCRKCEHYDKDNDKADGSHCKLGKGVKCTK